MPRSLCLPPAPPDSCASAALPQSAAPLPARSPKPPVRFSRSRSLPPLPARLAEAVRSHSRTTQKQQAEFPPQTRFPPPPPDRIRELASPQPSPRTAGCLPDSVSPPAALPPDSTLPPARRPRTPAASIPSPASEPAVSAERPAPSAHPSHGRDVRCVPAAGWQDFRTPAKEPGTPRPSAGASAAALVQSPFL